MQTRSIEKELIDLGPDYYTQKEYFDCLRSLFHISRFLGIARDTRRFLKSLPSKGSLLDIGCGGGLFLLHLYKHLPNWQFTGIDQSDMAINFANKQCRLVHKTLSSNLLFQTQNALTLQNKANTFDIVTATFVCHHLTNSELVTFLQEMQRVSKDRIIIHDLHRHILAEYCFWFITRFFFKNRLCQHDGLISIRRGFLRHEWRQILKEAGFKRYQLMWRWPFRWMIIAWKK